MADTEINKSDSDEPQQKNQENQKKGAKYDSGAADLEKVTDYAEEKEVFNSLEFDGVSKAISFIGDKRNKDQAAKLEKERELQKVSIKKEDVELIVKELEISRILAERTLREHCGNLINALTALTN
ncbi:hypothetical protein M8J75_010128 [Diaphorina citri]|nr:hypothetical protein M8J75_010128 [Diaphorina citri]KAI5728081.1 hypothetical protein M8J77_011248 [Diaphorina citri]